MDLYAGGTVAGTWPSEATFRIDSHTGGISLGILRNTRYQEFARYQQVRDTKMYEIPSSPSYQEVQCTEIQDTRKYDLSQNTKSQELRDTMKYDKPRTTRCQEVA